MAAPDKSGHTRLSHLTPSTLLHPSLLPGCALHSGGRPRSADQTRMAGPDTRSQAGFFSGGHSGVFCDQVTMTSLTAYVHQTPSVVTAHITAQTQYMRVGTFCQSLAVMCVNCSFSCFRNTARYSFSEIVLTGPCSPLWVQVVMVLPEPRRLFCMCVLHRPEIHCCSLFH